MGVFRNRFVVDRIYIRTVGLKLATTMMFSPAMAIRNLERADYRESLSRIVGRVFNSGECTANIALPRWARFEESLTAGWRASDAEIPVRSVRGKWKIRQRVHGLWLKQSDISIHRETKEHGGRKLIQKRGRELRRTSRWRSPGVGTGTGHVSGVHAEGRLLI